MKSILKNDLVSLRALEPEDISLLFQWENNPEFWRESNTLVPFSKEILEQYIHSAQDIYTLKQVRLMIVENQSQQTIGAIDLFDFDPKHQHAGVGILIDEKFRRNGFANNALSVLKNYALNVVGIRNLSASILEDNKGSQRLFEKNGFIKIGQRNKWYNDKGVWLDQFLYQCHLID